MILYRGKYNTANVMTNEIDAETARQIYSLLNHPAFAKTYIVIMPDCHAGKGAVVGYTSKMNNYIIPNIVGVDIGCGVDSYKLEGLTSLNFQELDNFIKEFIPSGLNRHSMVQPRIFDAVKHIEPGLIRVTTRLGEKYLSVLSQLGTLGGGNHFIEVNYHEGDYWLTIHSGSRNFGLKTANYYQNKAKELMRKMFVDSDAYKTLEYLPMELGGNEYLEDMAVAQEFARVNRMLIAQKLLEKFFEIKQSETITSVHNYINFEDNIVRKGAISAHLDKKLIIPLNMRDGTVFGHGKGSKKWNYSAPHGAGRLMSRTQAKAKLSLDKFTDEMKGVWSSCISKDTLDESPMAYKDPTSVLEYLEETVEIEFFARPVYNFKST